MNKKNYYLSILIGLLLSSNSWASDLTLSLGNLCEYVGQIQTDDSGKTNFCSFNPYLATSLDYQLASKFFLSPQIGLSAPKSGPDENIKRMTFIILMNSKYKTTYINLIGGLGLFLTRISGPGGEAELNNGTSTDSFPLPKEAVYTRNFIVNLGVDVDIANNWSAELRTYVFNLTASEDRAYSLGVHATYHFGAVL